MRFLILGAVLAVTSTNPVFAEAGDTSAKTDKTTQVAALATAPEVKTESKPSTEVASTERPDATSEIKVKKAAPATTLHAAIDLSSQTMTVRADGELLHTWKISSGRSGYITPGGSFRPSWMSRMHYSRKYDNAPMPYSVFFNGGIATHGTGAVGMLGQPASHGCIRLHTSNARKFYDLVAKHGKAHTRIVVSGTTPTRSAPVAQRRTRKPTTVVTSGAYTNSGYASWVPWSKQRARRDQYRRAYVQSGPRLVYPGDRW